ncbi:hypothetical protein SLS62_009248 [Diatrype stigma]|uniref:Cupin type-2 domain-containing protein n=1 Tax=Diatrype stigma TaxID=117547 RepID=A0AAN9YLE9_9PEZI
MSSSSATPLPNPRVITTGHQEDGTSVFQADRVIQPFQPFGPDSSGFSIFDTRATVPVSNQPRLPGDESSEPRLPRCPPAGTIFCVSDFAPGGRAPMHRTLSLDYAVVLSGEIVLELDGGAEKTVRAGEFIVQGGVNHGWANRTDRPCRVAFVMVGAEKVRLESGEELEETVFKK